MLKGAVPDVEHHHQNEHHVQRHEEEEWTKVEGKLLYDTGVGAISGSVYEASKVGLSVVSRHEWHPGVEQGDEEGGSDVEPLEVCEALAAHDVGEHVRGHAQGQEQLDPAEVDVYESHNAAVVRIADSCKLQEDESGSYVHQYGADDLIRGQPVHEVLVEPQKYHHRDGNCAHHDGDRRSASHNEMDFVSVVHYSLLLVARSVYCLGGTDG